ncbi:chorismate synthase, partial [Bacillus licheniformis]
GQELRFHVIENSLLRAVDEETERKMSEEVDRMKLQGDSPDGEVQIIASGVPIGLGSYASSDRRLDTKLGMEIFSIPSVKGLCIGRNLFSENRPGSKYHDIPIYGEKRFFHRSNNAGGIEGGVSNGEEIVLQVAVKPIPTLLKCLPSVDL